MINFDKPIEETHDGWKLLERKTINDRTLIAYYNNDTKQFNLVIFNLTEQPNELSQYSPETSWGYVTHMVSNMYKTEEAAEVVSLYLQDIEKNNYWWEEQ